MCKLTEYLRGPGGPRGVIHVSSLSAHTMALSLGETEPEKLRHWPRALPQNLYLDISDAQSFFFSRFFWSGLLECLQLCGGYL